MCDQAEAAVREGKLVLLLSDRYLVQGKLPIHALLATGAVHHRLVETRTALQVQSSWWRPARRAMRITSPA